MGHIHIRKSRYLSLNSRLLILSVPIVALIVTSSGTAASSAVSSPVKQFTVPPDVASVIWFDAPASTKCTVAGAQGNAVYYANDQDRVEIQLTPHAVPTPITTFVFQCGESTQTVELTVKDGATPLPAPPRIKHSGVVLPALSHDIAGTLTDNELHARGYPPRPNPQQYPGLYAKWLDLVSRSFEVVGGSGNPVPTDSTASNSWCGQELRPSGYPQYAVLGLPMNYVWGWWNVPTIVNTDPGAYMTEWVGLDGDGGLQDLMQTGVSAQVTCLRGSGNCPIHATSYNFFWGTLPATQYNELFSNNLAVTAGDDVEALVVVESVQNNITPIILEVWDLTNGTTTWETYNYTNCPFPGATAEWIVENPEVGSSGSDLAEWSGATQIYGAGGSLSNENSYYFNPGGQCYYPGYCGSYSNLNTYTFMNGINTADNDNLDVAFLDPDGYDLVVYWLNFN